MKPLYLQQTRYEVRPCRVWSDRAKDGIAYNFWYIYDTLNDRDAKMPTLERNQAFKTRKEAVARLTERLVQERVG